MTKLSEAQRRVLEAMRDGCYLQAPVERGMDGRVFWLDADGTHYLAWPVDPTDTDALLATRLIAPATGSDLPPFAYRITEAGRAALQQSGVGEGE